MKVPILDKGYLELVETWGSEERIIEAARMSTNKGFKGWEAWQCRLCDCLWRQHTDRTWSLYDMNQTPCSVCDNSEFFPSIIERVPGDERLLWRLYKHEHTSPFEMAGAVIEVSAPLFVFREWHRHRTQSYNEMSARYTPLPDHNYLPTAESLWQRSKATTMNKQAGKATEHTPSLEEVASWLSAVSRHYIAGQELYKKGLELGIPKEVARIVIPVARYSRMRASANLHNWIRFLRLRTAQGAQEEIRSYALALESVLSTVFPRTIQLFRAERKDKENYARFLEQQKQTKSQ